MRKVDRKSGAFREPDRNREGYVTFPAVGTTGRSARYGEISVPEKFSERIESLQIRENDSFGTEKVPLAKKIIPRGVSQPPIHARPPRFTKAVDIYLEHGWRFDGQHMISIGFATRDATNEDLAVALRKTGRCYCTERCLDPDSYGRDDDPQLIEVLKVRMVVAQANGIPLDGTDKHEAEIDAALSHGEKHAEADEG